MESRLIRLLRAVLPVRDLRQCVQRLALGWREVAPAQAAIVSAIRPGELRLVGAGSSVDSPAFFIDGEVAASGAWSDDDVLKALLAHAEFPKFAASPQLVIPFISSGEPQGGVVLFGASPKSPPAERFGELGEASDRLLQQAISLDQVAEGRGDLLVPDASRLEALAEFAAGAGHEINNPLATISGRVQMLLKDEQDPDRRQALSTIGGQTLRVRDMIGDVMLFARPPAPVLTDIDLVEVLDEVLGVFSSRRDAQGCTIRLTVDDSVPVRADKTQLSVVISSLIENSLNALVEGGEIFITARAGGQAASEPSALLSVADNGPGLSDLERQHLFDPFYSGRQAGRGLGFGLSKCWRIVSNHGGRIEVDCGSSKSVCFRVLWPIPG